MRPRLVGRQEVMSECSARGALLDMDRHSSTEMPRDAKRHADLDALQGATERRGKKGSEQARRQGFPRNCKAIAVERELIRLDESILVSAKQIGRNCTDAPTVDQVKGCAARPFGR